jgi:ABC-type transport system involved in cytochrome c biogenesis permease subunit
MSAFEALLYALGAVLYALHFVRRQPAVGLAATAALSAGVVAHTFLMGMATVREGALPLVGAGDALSGFVWTLAMAYLYVELTSGERAMGAFIAPLVAALSLVALASAQPGPRPAVLDSPLFAVHVLTVLFAYAAFALAAVMGVTYVLLFRELKEKQPGVFFARLPSLAALDQMNGRAIVAGFVCLTVGLAVGVAWALQASRVLPLDPRVEAMSLADPKILVAIGSWLLYAFLVVARTAFGWSGRRTAWLSAAGFVVVLVSLLPIAYLAPGSHSFS